MSSEDPIRQVPDELFRKASAKPERSVPDALFGPPPAPPVVETEPAESGTDDGESPSEPEGSAPASSVDPPPDRTAPGESSAVLVATPSESGSGAADSLAAAKVAAAGVHAAADSSSVSAAPVDESAEFAVGVGSSQADGEFAGTVQSPVRADESADSSVSDGAATAGRPVLLVIADSLSYFGPKGGLPADHPRIWPNLVGAELDWDVEVVGRIGWTCRDAYWALIGDPRVWAAVPRAGAVVFAVGGMDSLPSPLPTALRELIRYIRPPVLRRGVRATYTWLQPKLSKLGRPVALPPKVSVDYLEQSREALAHLRPELPFVAVLPSVHNCAAYGRVHSGRERAVKALRAWSARTSVPLVDLGEAVRDNIFAGDANPDGIHWGWAGHTAVANAMVKTLQEVR